MIRNNNIYIVLALACAAIAALSCTKMNQAESDDKEIVMTPLAKKMTKAIIDGTKYPDEETIGVYAFYTSSPAGTSWGAAKNTTETYLDNVAFHKNGASWAGYDYEAGRHKPYFWPASGSLFFAAYSPYTLCDKISYDKENGSLNLSEYTINPADYQDFLYAEISDVASSVSKRESSVVFTHALAMLEFTAKLENADDVRYIDIHSITTASIPLTGAFVSRDVQSQSPLWTRNANPTIPIVIFDAGETDGVDNGVSLSAETATSLGKCLVIPGSAVQIEVRYRIHYDDSQHLTEKYIILPADAISVWEPGKKYSYNLKLGVDYINIEPIIGTDWK